MFSSELFSSFFVLLVISTVCQAKKEPEIPRWAPQYKVGSTAQTTLQNGEQHAHSALPYILTFPYYTRQIQVSWNFTVPYVSEIQKGGLIYQYKAFQDYANAQQKVIRDGVETVIINVDEDIMYEIFPASDKLLCWKGSVHGGTGPTRRRTLAMSGIGGGGAEAHISRAENGKFNFKSDDPPQSYLGFILPDLSEKRWEYAGTEKYERTGRRANAWRWDLSEGDVEMHYVMYTDADDDSPLELNMLGINLYTGGHKDRYIAYSYGYVEVSDGFPAGLFAPPEDLDCSQSEPDALTSLPQKPLENNLPRAHLLPHLLRGVDRVRPSHLLRALMPNVHFGDAAYDVFCHRHGRRHSSPKEYHTRHRHFKDSARFVEARSKSSSSFADSNNRHHAVGLNHLADLSRQEYLSLLGRRPGSGRAGHAIATLRNFTTPNSHFLPGEVIWKGTPVDSPVRDQAACGSCWAFSAVASLESALYRATGRPHLLSEQHMIDCGWEGPTPTTGCYGGEQADALGWALRNGGLAAAEKYPYRGVNDFCRRGVKAIPLAGHTVVVEGGEEAVMAALLAKGPMAVSVDAESDEFRFYAGGVYSNPECATAAADLNHAVIVSGYGIANGADGTPIPYWLVKNMWSPYWGEDGYIRIARKPNDCGIATQPLYVELDRRCVNYF